MREILYRGKFGNDWKYGYLSVEPKGLVIKEPYEHNQSNIWHIDPETVGQYTGLTDKNGTKIFEGDILNITNSNCAIWYVDYKNTAFCCNQVNANYICVLDEFMEYLDVEVIGNIHDNPELLEVI